mmetsp:Transcript_30254/g.96680  ORF Transcript_30254/g.96680 Transcript_30254/m.96680 type:complete len:1010 (+) Transcript_30254:50-3079(+)
MHGLLPGWHSKKLPCISTGCQCGRPGLEKYVPQWPLTPHRRRSRCPDVFQVAAGLHHCGHHAVRLGLALATTVLRHTLEGLAHVGCHGTRVAADVDGGVGALKQLPDLRALLEDNILNVHLLQAGPAEGRVQLGERARLQVPRELLAVQVVLVAPAAAEEEHSGPQFLALLQQMCALLQEAHHGCHARARAHHDDGRQGVLREVESARELAHAAGQLVPRGQPAEQCGRKAAVQPAGARPVLHLAHADRDEPGIGRPRRAGRDAVVARPQRLGQGAELPERQGQLPRAALEHLREAHLRARQLLLVLGSVGRQRLEPGAGLLTRGRAGQARQGLAAGHEREVRDPLEHQLRRDAPDRHLRPQRLVAVPRVAAALAALGGVPANGGIRGQADGLQGNSHEIGVVAWEHLQVVAGSVLCRRCRQPQRDVAHAAARLGLLAELPAGLGDLQAAQGVLAPLHAHLFRGGLLVLLQRRQGGLDVREQRCATLCARLFGDKLLGGLLLGRVGGVHGIGSAPHGPEEAGEPLVEVGVERGRVHVAGAQRVHALRTAPLQGRVHLPRELLVGLPLGVAHAEDGEAQAGQRVVLDARQPRLEPRGVVGRVAVVGRGDYDHEPAVRLQRPVLGSLVQGRGGGLEAGPARRSRHLRRELLAGAGVGAEEDLHQRPLLSVVGRGALVVLLGCRRRRWLRHQDRRRRGHAHHGPARAVERPAGPGVDDELQLVGGGGRAAGFQAGLQAVAGHRLDLEVQEKRGQEGLGLEEGELAADAGAGAEAPGMVGVGVAALHGLGRKTVGVVGVRVAELPAPVLGVRVQRPRHDVHALALEDPVATNERVVRHVPGQHRHRAVEPQGLPEALLHVLQLGHVVRGGLRAALQDRTDLIQRPRLAVRVLCEQLDGEAQRGRCGLVACDHEVDDLAVEGSEAHLLAAGGLVLEHGADDGVPAAQLTRPRLLDHLVHQVVQGLLGLLIPSLQPGLGAEERDEALKAVLALRRDAEARKAEAESEVVHEWVGR